MRDRIEQARRAQSVEELERKADKAMRRDNVWTQEEIDLATVRAKAAVEAVHFDDRTPDPGASQ